MKCPQCGKECNVVSFEDKQVLCEDCDYHYASYSPHEVVEEIQERLPEGFLIEVEDEVTFKITNTAKGVQELVTVDRIDLFLYCLFAIDVVNQ